MEERKTSLDLPHLLHVARKAAADAGKAIMKIYNSGNFGISVKEDQSPLTLADKTAHGIIVEELVKTGLPILSEEGHHSSYRERNNWNYFWLVDPLDGTKEFIKRSGEFTVNIALIQHYIPISGVIYAPSLNVLYYGSKQTGVHKVKDNNKIQLLPVKEKTELNRFYDEPQITIVASKSHMNNETSAFINKFNNPRLVSVGSSLKLMMVAERSADIYPRFGPTMEWDTAAGHAILNALNLGIYQEDLQSELVYNKKDLLNPSFLAF